MLLAGTVVRAASLVRGGSSALVRARSSEQLTARSHERPVWKTVLQVRCSTGSSRTTNGCAVVGLVVASQWSCEMGGRRGRESGVEEFLLFFFFFIFSEGEEKFPQYLKGWKYIKKIGMRTWTPVMQRWEDVRASGGAEQRRGICPCCTLVGWGPLGGVGSLGCVRPKREAGVRLALALAGFGS